MRSAAIFLLAITAAAQNRTITASADVRWLAFSRDGQTLYGICGDNKLRQWDAKSGALRNSIGWAGDQGLEGIHPLTALRALAGQGPVTLADLGTGASIPMGGWTLATRVAVTPDGRAIAAGSRVAGNSREEVIRMWDASGKERFTVPSGIGGTSAMAISPEGSLLAAGSWDTNIRVWNTRNGELVKVIEDLPVAMFGVAFSPDGRSFAAAGVDRTVYIWDARTWKLDRKLAGQPEMISAIAFSPDGKSLATGGFNDITSRHRVSILVWDFQSGKVIKTFPAPHRVSSVALSPDGRMLASVGGEQTIRVFAVR